jgi:hypothetical protein
MLTRGCVAELNAVREWRGVLLPEFVKLALRNGLALELRILIDL